MSLSLGAAARLQLRRHDDADAPPQVEVDLAPRSFFVLAGEVRRSWQHRIPPVNAQRYSFTVRSAAQAS